MTPNNSRGGRERQYLLLHFAGRSLVRAGTASPKPHCRPKVNFENNSY